MILRSILQHSRRAATSVALSRTSCKPAGALFTARGMSTVVSKKELKDSEYLFDLNGYLVIRGVFSAEEIAQANQVIDQKADLIKERKGVLRNTKQGSAMSGDGETGRLDLGGILEWGDDSSFFRSVLAHPTLVPYYNLLLGKGYRMDHLPFVIAQNQGSEGFALHGGMVDVSSGEFNNYLSYQYIQGKMSNSLMGVSVVLSDHNPGDGGFCVVRGSHKSNMAAPESFINGDEHQEFLYQPAMKAGDVLMFSEATVHGALPWSAEHQRRVALYRFCPPTMAYGRSYYPSWSDKITDGMTDEERVVLQAPYAVRLDRPHLVYAPDEGGASGDSSSGVSGVSGGGGGGGGYGVHSDDENGDDKDRLKIVVQSRMAEKRAFDKEVFKSDYF